MPIERFAQNIPRADRRRCDDRLDRPPRRRAHTQTRQLPATQHPYRHTPVHMGRPHGRTENTTWPIFDERYWPNSKSVDNAAPTAGIRPCTWYSDGHTSASVLYEEYRAMDYHGSDSTVRDYLRPMLKAEARPGPTVDTARTFGTWRARVSAGDCHSCTGSPRTRSRPRRMSPTDSPAPSG